jgi:hypothetical protein
VSVLVIVLQSPEIPEGLMNNPVYVSRMKGRKYNEKDVKYIQYDGEKIDKKGRSVNKTVKMVMEEENVVAVNRPVL